MQVIEQLRQFLKVAESRCGWSLWLESKREIAVYVRCSSHSCGELGIVTTLDIANIQVRTKPGQGTYSRFLRLAHAMHPFQATYVENIYAERFMAYHQRLGFLRADQDICVYLPTGVEIPDA